MSDNICILISTCDKYAALAEYTTKLIQARWANHPKIFVCGVKHPFSKQVEFLNLENDVKDWIGITETAVSELMAKGYTKCYLILDDHPPIGKCNNLHLNKTLPNLMDELNAAYIGLYGWDQNTLSDGVVMPSSYHKVQNQADTFLWRYSLHPALWNLEALQDVCLNLPVLQGDMTTRSVWAFERRSGDIRNNESLAHWQGKSYRVFGVGMLAGQFRVIRSIYRESYFYIVNALLWFIGRIFGTLIQEQLFTATLPERLFFDGPYPLYWSGVLQKGRLNQNFEKFLLRHKRTDELDDFRRVIGRFDP